MRARKSKGGSTTIKGANATYHQVSSPSSAFYGTTPEKVSIDSSSSSSETSSLESTTSTQECSVALSRNIGSKLTLSASNDAEQPIISSNKAGGVGAYNLEQIAVSENGSPNSHVR